MRVPVVAQHRAMHGWMAPFGWPVLPVVNFQSATSSFCRRRRLELVGHGSESIPETHRRRREPAARRRSPESRPPSPRPPPRPLHRCTRVVGVVLRPEERVRLGGDRADLLPPVPEATKSTESPRTSSTRSSARTPSSRSMFPYRLTIRASSCTSQAHSRRSTPPFAAALPTLRSTNQVARLSSRGRSTCVSISAPLPGSLDQHLGQDPERLAPPRPRPRPASRSTPVHPHRDEIRPPARMAAGMSTYRSSSASIRSLL